jgi:single-strand DNA-binding protein
MINSTQITITGNMGSDAELRYTPTGTPVVTFSVAVAQRKYDKESGKWADAGTTWYRVNAWRDLAEHCAESLTRGTRVIVMGALASRDWTDGDKRGTSWEITADAIGAELTYATATVRKTSRSAVPLPPDPWDRDGDRSAPAETASEPA